MNIGTSSSQTAFFQPAQSLNQRASSVEVDERNQGSVLQPLNEVDAGARTLSADESAAADNNFPRNASETTSTPSQSDQAQDQAGEPRQEQDRLQARQEQVEQLEIQSLAARDREVKQHERAHAAVGGQYAGAPRYQYERGPDGVNYAVAGEVSISTSKISGDPEATIEKAQVVRRAALAPAEPSPQDRRVAALATQIESEARVELSEVQRQERLQQQALREQDSEDSGQNIGSPSAVESASAGDEAGLRDSTDDTQGDDNQNAINRRLVEINQQFVSIGRIGQISEPGDILSQVV